MPGWSTDRRLLTGTSLLILPVCRKIIVYGIVEAIHCSQAQLGFRPTVMSSH